MSSAAAVGVAARWSATKSAIVKSTSCPIPVTTGITELYIARATTSSLNSHRSSNAPPPRAMISTSVSCRLFALAIAAAILLLAPFPCTGTG